MVEVLQDKSVQVFVKRLIEAIFDVSDEVAAGGPMEDLAAGRRMMEWFKSRADIEELIQLLPDATKRIFSNWDELTETLIVGCLEPDNSGDFPNLQFDDLSYDDVARLRTAVFECNDFRGMLETEKNSLVGVFSQMINLDTSTGSPNQSSQDGGQAGKQSSPEDSQVLTGSAL